MKKFIAWAESIGWQDVQNAWVSVDPEDPAFTLGYFTGRDDSGLLHHVWALSSTDVEGSWRLDDSWRAGDPRRKKEMQ